MATPTRKDIQTGKGSTRPRDPIFDNLVTQKVSPTGPSAQANAINHLNNAEPTCRSEAAFMFMFPQLTSLPGFARSFAYSRILREQTALKAEASVLEDKAKNAASNSILDNKKGSLNTEQTAEGETVSSSSASFGSEHRVLMDAFNVDLSYEDNAVDPSDAYSITFNMDDLTQACPTGTGKTNVRYLGKLSKPFIMPVAYAEELHQSDMFGVLAPKLTPGGGAGQEDKQALATVVAWKAFSFHNQFRRTQGGLNPIYSLIGSRYITDWAAAFAPALKSVSTSALEADSGKIDFSGGRYQTVVKARGLFTLSSYAKFPIDGFSTGMYYKPGLWGVSLNKADTVGSIDKSKVKTREYMNLHLKTKAAKQELELASKQSPDSTKAQRTNTDILRAGFEWQDYVDSLLQATKGASKGSDRSFDILQSKYLPLVVKIVKDGDGSYIVNTASEDAALEVAKSLLVYGYEVPPLYELSLPKPKELSLSDYQERIKGFGLSYTLDKNYTFLGTIATPKNAIPLPAAFDSFRFDKMWKNRDPNDKNYFDLLQEDLIVSDLELYTMVNTVVDFYVRQAGGLTQFQEAAFKNTPWLKNGSLVINEMASYTRNDANPPVPIVANVKVDNYVPHAFSSVDGGKMLFGKRIITTDGKGTLEDVELKQYYLMKSTGTLVDRMPGEVQLTTSPALVVGKPLPPEGKIEPEAFVLSNAVFPVAPNSAQAKKDAEEAKKLSSDRQLIGELAGFIQNKVPSPMRFDTVALGFDQGVADVETPDGIKASDPVPVTTQKNYALNSVLDGVIRMMFNTSVLGTKIVAPLIGGALAARTPGSKMFEFYIDNLTNSDDASLIVADIGNRVNFDWAIRTGALANEFPTDLLQFIRPAEYNTTGGKFIRTFLTFALKAEPPPPGAPNSGTYFVPGRETCYVDMSNLSQSGNIGDLFADRLVAIYLKTPADRLAPTGLQVHGHLVENLMAYYFWLCCLFVLKQYGVFPPGDLGANVKSTVGDKGYIPLDDFYTLVNITSSQNNSLIEAPVYPMYLDDMGKVKMNGNVPKPTTTEFTLPKNFATQIGMLQAGFIAKGALLNLGYRAVIPDISKLLNLKNAKRMMLGGSHDPKLTNILSYDAQTEQENPILASNLGNGQMDAERLAAKSPDHKKIGSYHIEEPVDLISTESTRNIDVSGPAIFDVSIEDVAVRPIVSTRVSLKASATATVPFAPGFLPQTIKFRPYYPRGFLDVFSKTGYGFAPTGSMIKDKATNATINLDTLLLPKNLLGNAFSEGAPIPPDRMSETTKAASVVFEQSISRTTAQLTNILTEADIKLLKEAKDADIPQITALLGDKMPNVATTMSGSLCFNSRISIHDIIGNPSYPMNTTTNSPDNKWSGGVSFGFLEQGENMFFPVDFVSSIGALMSQSTIARSQRKGILQGLVYMQTLLKGRRRLKAYPNAKNPLAGLYIGSTTENVNTVGENSEKRKDSKTNFFVAVIPDIPVSGLPSIETMMAGGTITSNDWKTGALPALDDKVFKEKPSYGIVAPGNIYGTYGVTDSAAVGKQTVDSIIKGRNLAANPSFHPPLLAMDTYGYLQHHINGAPTDSSWVKLRHDYNTRYTSVKMDAWADIVDKMLEAVKPKLAENGVDKDLKHKAIRFYATNLQLLKIDGSQTDNVSFLIPNELVRKYILEVPQEKLFKAGGAFEVLGKDIGTTRALVDAITGLTRKVIVFPPSFSVWATGGETQNLGLWFDSAWSSSVAINGDQIMFSPSAYFLARVLSLTGQAAIAKFGKTPSLAKNKSWKPFTECMQKLESILYDANPSEEWKSAINLLHDVDPLLINGGLSIRYRTDKTNRGNSTAEWEVTSGKVTFEFGLGAFFSPGLGDNGTTRSSIGTFNGIVAKDVSNVSLSYGTVFGDGKGGKSSASLFVAKSPIGTHRRVVTHTGLTFENTSNAALSPFEMSGIVSIGDVDNAAQTVKLEGVQFNKQFNLINRKFSEEDGKSQNISAIGFDVGEACRQYLALKWWIKPGNAPDELQTLIKARTKNLHVMDFQRNAAEMALYLVKGNLPVKSDIYSILSASYKGSKDLAQHLRQTATSFNSSGDGSSGSTSSNPKSLYRNFLNGDLSGPERRPYMPSYGAMGIPMSSPRGTVAETRAAATAIGGVNWDRTLPLLRFVPIEKNLVLSDLDKSRYYSRPDATYRSKTGEIQESVDTDLLWLLWSLYSMRVFVGTDKSRVQIIGKPATINVIDGPKPPDPNPSSAKLDKIGDLINSGERTDVTDSVLRF